MNSADAPARSGRDHGEGLNGYGVYGLAPLPHGVLEDFRVEALRRAAQDLDDLRAVLPLNQLVVLALDDLQRGPVEATLAVVALYPPPLECWTSPVVAPLSRCLGAAPVICIS